MKLVNNLDFNKYEARNMKLQNLATAPSSPTLGQAYYDTTLNRARVWNGTAWQNFEAGTITAIGVTAPITSSGGSAPTIGISAATTGAAGSMSAADKSKLDGIAAGATVNSPDATLLNRANHTGSQAISTVTGLQTALDAKVDDSQVGAANGVASLDAGGKVPTSQMPNLSLTDVNVVADYTARDALTVQEGDVAVVTGTSETFIYDGVTWQLIRSPADGVTSITAGNGITSTGGATPTIAVDPAVVVRKAAATIGDGVATAYTITHNLNTRDVDVTVYTNAAPYDEVLADIEHTSTTQVTVRFAAAPAASAYRVVVQG